MPKILEYLLPILLGGTNIFSIVFALSERKKRIHEAEKTRFEAEKLKHEAELMDINVLDTMRLSYNNFANDMKISMDTLRQEKTILQEELSKLRKDSNEIYKKLNQASLKCEQNCFINEKKS